MAGATKKRPGVEIARQHFLYGGVTDVMELAKLAGIHDSTVRRHVGAWEKEHAEMLIATNPRLNNNSLSVPDEVLESHKADLAFFRRNLDILKQEHDALDPVLDEMYQFSTLMLGDEAQVDKFLAIFEKYCRMCMNRKNLMSQIVKIKDLLDAKTGIDSLKNVQEATAKAVSVASAKSEPTETGKGEARVVSDTVFRKRID